MSSCGGRGERAPWCLLYEGTNPIYEAHTFPKILPPHISPRKLGFQHGFGVDRLLDESSPHYLVFPFLQTAAIIHGTDGETEPWWAWTKAPSSLSTPFLKASETRTVKTASHGYGDPAVVYILPLMQSSDSPSSLSKNNMTERKSINRQTAQQNFSVRHTDVL